MSAAIALVGDWSLADQSSINRIRHATVQSELARARVQGMKLRAQIEPPTAAPQGFPYPHRTCAEWKPFEASEE